MLGEKRGTVGGETNFLGEGVKRFLFSTKARRFTRYPGQCGGKEGVKGKEKAGWEIQKTDWGFGGPVTTTGGGPKRGILKKQSTSLEKASGGSKKRTQ